MSVYNMRNKKTGTRTGVKLGHSFVQSMTKVKENII